jgi:hypothetical protein
MLSIQLSFITGVAVGIEWVELEKDNFLAIDLLIIRVVLSFN